MRVVLTGGAGFLGQHLIPLLADAGMTITVMDLHPPKVPITEIDRYCSAAHYGIDITHAQGLDKHLEGADVVYHLAGLVSFWRKAAKSLHSVNVTGTANIADAAIRVGIGKLVHISSVAAVGFDRKSSNPIDEDFLFPWETAKNKHYMLSKHLAEREVERIGSSSSSAPDTLIVCPGLMWGPGDLTNSAKLITKLHAGKIPACPPGGTNIVDVRDVARGLVECASSGVSGQRYIFGGENVPFRRVYDVIAGELEVESPKRNLPGWIRPLLSKVTLLREMIASKPPELTSDNIDSAWRTRYFSSAKAERDFGWKAEISFGQMIRDSVSWLRDHSHLPSLASTSSTGLTESSKGVE